MSIQYSGNAGIYSFTTGTSTASTDYETALVTNLQTAGWTATIVAASDIATFSANPTDGDTITLDSSTHQEVYRFKTVMAQANDVKLDSTLALTIGHFVLAVNGTGTPGTDYFAGTVASPTITASASSPTVGLIYKTTGSAGNGAAVSSSSGNVTFTTSTLQGGYTKLLSAITPQNLQCAVKIFTASGSFYNPGTTITIIPMSYDGSYAMSSGGLTNTGVINAAGNSWKLVANKYQWLAFIPGSTDSTKLGNGVGMGVPYITSNLQAPLILAATNAVPISCNVPAHGFVNGQSVYITQGLGNTAVNGTWTIAVVDANNFTLNGSTGNGTYVASSASVTNLTQTNSVAQAVWGCGSIGGGCNNLRNSPTLISNGCYQLVNTQSVNNSQGTDSPQLIYPRLTNAAVTQNLQWYDNTFVMDEPFISWGISSGAQPKLIGQLWDAVMVRTALSVDQTASFDAPSHNFWTVGIDGGQNSIMFATS